MNIREEARKVGGDEMVARVDKAQAMEKQALDAFADLYKSMFEEHGMTDGQPDPEKVQLLNVAFAEATSDAYARAAVAVALQSGDDQGRGMLVAIQSLTTNMTSQFETKTAKASGIGDKIMACFKGTK